MDIQEFRTHAHAFVDWMADYLDNLEGPTAESWLTSEVRGLVRRIHRRAGRDLGHFERFRLPFQVHEEPIRSGLGRRRRWAEVDSAARPRDDRESPTTLKTESRFLEPVS